ncbi:Tryptophan synthase alpha chain [Minicystis rosea]|nr:Tryptophan synthase alpha chain [Minicystis rosea]
MKGALLAMAWGMVVVGCSEAPPGPVYASTTSGSGGATSTTGSGGAGGACTPESDAALCEAHDTACGPLSTTDACGQPRIITSCGDCVAPETCGGAGQPGVCGCIAEGGVDICMTMGAECGLVTWTDTCNQPHTESCGDCIAPETCGGTDIPNHCGVAPPPTWKWQVPTITGESLNGVWAISPTDVWAVGGLGTIVHWDGQGLSVVPSGVTVQLTGIWGSAADDLWAIGHHGTILHYDGNAWLPVASPATGELVGITGSGPADVWIHAPTTGTLHYDGSQWSLGDAQWAIAPVSSNDVWSLPGTGNVKHDDGAGWTSTALGSSSESFNATFVAGANDIWAVGQQSAGMLGFLAIARHYDGASWTLVPTSGMSGYENGLDHVWASATGDVWTIGFWGAYLRAAGSATWTLQGFPTRPNDVRGSDATNVWIAGGQGQMGRWDGATLAPITEPPASCWMVRGRSSSNVWASCQRWLEHWDGTSWARVDAPIMSNEAITGLWLSESGPWIVTSNGRVLHRVGASWTASMPFPGWSLEGLTGTSDTDLWVRHLGGPPIHFDGTSWEVVNSGLSSPQYVWPAAPGDVWQFAPSPYHFNGNSWTAVPWPSGGAVVDVHGNSPTDVWAVTAYDVMHWDGAAWTKSVNLLDISDSIGSFIAVWAAGSKEAFAATNFGVVCHYDGSAWTMLPAPTSMGMTSLWGASPTDLFLVGNGILRYH